MQSIDLIRDNLKKSEERVLGGIEAMRESGCVSPTAEGGCHTLWVLGHLAFSESSVIQSIMLGKKNPLAEWKDLFSFGTEASTDAAQYPPFDEVLAKCREVRADTIALLDSFSEEDLDKTSEYLPDGYETLFGTYRLCLQFSADHWYMHRGQLADSRRAAGIGRAGM